MTLTSLATDYPLVRRLTVPAVSLLLFIVALFAIRHLAQDVSYHELIAELGAMPAHQLALAVLATFGSYAALVCYDWTALRYVGKLLPWRSIALGGGCAYAVSNAVGLGAVSGGAVRFKIYGAAGLHAADIARVTLFCVGSFGIGIHFVGVAALVINPHVLAALVGLSPDTMRWLGIAILAGMAGVAAAAFVRKTPLLIGRWRVSLPGPRLALQQLAISVADIMFAGLALYVLLPGGTMPFAAFLTIYSVATLAGLASHVPGGVGVFEGVILLALRDRAPPEAITAALLVYRGIYYLMPLIIAGVVLSAAELLTRRLVVGRMTRQIAALSGQIIPVVISALAFLSGLVLLLSTVTPSAPGRLHVLHSVMPLVVIEVSQVLAALVGLALLVLARGLFRRLNAAYWLTLGFCAAGIILCLAKGIDYEEAGFLTLMAVLLASCRSKFQRRTALLDAPLTPGWVLATVAAVAGMTWVLMFSFRHVDYDGDLWTSFSVGQEAARAMRATTITAVAAAVGGLALLLRAPRVRSAPPSADDLVRAASIVRNQDHADANLVRMGDKSLLFSHDGTAFIMYGVHGTSWIALGDPVGPPSSGARLAWRFRELADRAGGQAVFYQVRPETLPIYLDMGMSLLKLGEEAIVPLDSFSLKGPERSDLRYVERKGRKDGLGVEFLPAGTADLEVLKRISDQWLEAKSTREKRFSLGAFHPAYVGQFGVALVHWHGKPVAFATMMAATPGTEATLDLMRHVAEAPRYTMQYLFIEILLHCQAAGFRRFSLGMAPLSGLEHHALAPMWHRVGNLIYSHGEHFYNFKGLHAFKQKFDPVWEPRYLAASGRLSPVMALKDVTVLVGGGLQGVVLR